MNFSLFLWVPCILSVIFVLDVYKRQEDCQDSMENALKQLDDLNAQINAFPDKTTIAQALERMKQDYQTTMSKCILMRAAIAKYNGQADGNDGDDVESLARSFIKMCIRDRRTIHRRHVGNENGNGESLSPAM